MLPPSLGIGVDHDSGRAALGQTAADFQRNFLHEIRVEVVAAKSTRPLPAVDAHAVEADFGHVWLAMERATAIT